MKSLLLSLRAALSLLVVLTLSALAQTKPTPPDIFPLEQAKAGMRGYALTVFEGATPERVDVEVLGVLKNVLGPKSDLILVRLHGPKIEHTGVLAGMSGSPVYLDGKLAGALAYRIGQFSKEPIAGITPIAEMLEIDEIDQRPAAGKSFPARPVLSAQKTSSAAGGDQIQQYAQHLVPIEAPMIFSGFSEEAIRMFSAQLAASGLRPVLGAGSASDELQPEPIEPGSAVSAVIVRGDMNIASTCTVTHADAQRLLACGHPLLQFGSVDMPMTKSRVLYSLASPMNAIKIATTTESIGSFVQDRRTGILGRFGRDAQMIPVALTVHSPAGPKRFRYEVLNNGKITPVLMMATVFNALQGNNEYGEDITYRLQGRIRVAGYPDVAMENMFAPSDASIPTAFGVAMSLGERFGRIYQNPYTTPEISGVELDLDLVNERRAATLESARVDVTEARPGDEIVIETVLRPYRGDRIVRQIPVRIPTSTPQGALRILVSDGDTLDRVQRITAMFSKRLDLGSTIATLNKEHANHRLYVSLLEPNPQAMVEDKVMPTLPLSVMNVMDGMRGTREMVVVGESAVNEFSTPLDYVVSGAQIITVTIK